MSAIVKSIVHLAGKSCRSQQHLIKRSNFISAVSLEKLYPNKPLKLFTPNQVPEKGREKFSGFIPIDKLQITYSRSSAPGGQNVNTLNSKVDLRFHVESAEWLDGEVRSRLLEMNKTKVNKDGFLVLRSEKTRSQQLNTADVMLKLRNLIRTAAETPEEPSEESLEKARKRQLKAARIRLHEKRNRSQTKAQRQSPNFDF